MEGESSLHLKDELPSSLSLKELLAPEGWDQSCQVYVLHLLLQKQKYIYIYQHTKTPLRFLVVIEIVYVVTENKPFLISSGINSLSSRERSVSYCVLGPLRLVL